MKPARTWHRTVGFQILGGSALFASFWFPPLVLVGLSPLAGAIEVPKSHGAFKTYLAAWFGGLAFFLPGVQWLRYCDDSAWLAWLLLAVYLSLYFPAFVWLARRVERSLKLPLIIVVPVIWTSLEFLRMYALSGFGWLLLAHSITAWTPALQIADLGGVYAVSFVIALVNAAVAAWLHDRSQRWNLWLTAAVIVLTLGYGGVRLRTAKFEPGPMAILVQTNLLQRLKLDNTDETFRAVDRVSSKAKGIVADLVVWPETSYPYMFGDYDRSHTDEQLCEQFRARLGPPTGRMAELSKAKHAQFIRGALDDGRGHLADICDRLNKPLLVSVLRYELRPNPPALYNSAALFAPNRGQVAYYDKLHLVPFGEYVPLKDSMPLLKILLPYDSDTMGVDEGTRFEILQHGNLSFAPTICFEDTLPQIGRGFMLNQTPTKHVDFFVSQCNDGWFQGSIEGDLHLAASIFRCIECRRSMIRSANMNVTAGIDPNGKLIARLPTFAEDILKIEIPLDRRETLYVRFGDWLPMGCALIVFAGVLASFVKRKQRPVEATIP